MIIKQIYTNCLSQASYYIESKGESIIIDPIRDIDGYDELINKNNSELKFILETHFHADFISGHIELSNKYNVPIIFGPHADTNFNSINKEDGEIIKLGDIQIKVIHTPGHTLESVCYLLFDENNNQKALFTGDTLFIGDVGRPDLAVDNNLSINDLASMLYDSLYNKIMKLDEKIMIYPAHGPGTQCGKSLSEETFSTLKEQKLSNYALMFKNKTDFVSSIIKNLPPAPDYFKDSALLNKNGYKSHLYDFDSVLIDWLADEFNKDEGIDLRKDPMALQRLNESAENAKKELSSSKQTEINLPFITADSSGPKHLNMTLTRANFEQLVSDLVERVVAPCKQALKDAKLSPSDINEVILVGGSTRIPAIQEKVKEIFGKEPNQSVNPDEVVALGAAIQGGVLAGDVDDVLLLDVTPLTLGIETMGGVATPLIEKNTTIPTQKSQIFSTAADNQPMVEIHVVQGERSLAKDNKSLGRFHLDGIPPAPRGTPQIEVSFDMDADGILNVKAVDKATSKEQSIRIEAQSGLSDQEIEKMVNDAKKHEAEDKAKKEEIDTKNQAEQLVFQTEKQMKDLDDKLSDDDKNDLNDALEKLKKANESSVIDDIKSEMENLNSVWSSKASSMYDASNASSQEPPVQESEPGGAEAKDDKKIKDADFEVVED